VAVALAASADDPIGAVEPLTVLARADQFHLPEALDAAITVARQACADGDAETGLRRLDQVLAEARRAGF
jgi:hypothetical protein